MKLRNKKTGEIGYLIVGKDSDHYIVTNDDWEDCGKYDSLAELNKEWEDVSEEPKGYWCVDCDGSTSYEKDDGADYDKGCKAIGNYFETKEEAEKAVEKLKAWKRLKDKGFRFILDGETEMPMFVYSGANGEKCITSAEESKQCRDDIKLLFGGEE